MTKVCTFCGVEKELRYFSKAKTGALGVNSQCKECINYKDRSLYHLRKKYGPNITLRELSGVTKETHRCGTCKKVKKLKEFYKDRTRPKGVSSKCKTCQNEYLKGRRKKQGRPDLITRRKWSESNRDRLRVQDAEYRENNRDKLRLIEQRRRARLKNLPDTLTEEDLNETLTFFNNKCSLCDDEEFEFDHFIPISTNRGGTIVENIIPLCETMNSSKGAKNPFEWAHTFLSEEELKRFDRVVEFLSRKNNMTTKEFKKYVDECFEKTNLKEIG